MIWVFKIKKELNSSSLKRGSSNLKMWSCRAWDRSLNDKSRALPPIAVFLFLFFLRFVFRTSFYSQGLYLIRLKAQHKMQFKIGLPCLIVFMWGWNKKWEVEAWRALPARLLLLTHGLLPGTHRALWSSFKITTYKRLKLK